MSRTEDLQELLVRAETVLNDMIMFQQGVGTKAVEDIVQDWINVASDYDPYGFSQDPITLEDGVYGLLMDTGETIRCVEDWVEDIREDLHFWDEE